MGFVRLQGTAPIVVAVKQTLPRLSLARDWFLHWVLSTPSMAVQAVNSAPTPVLSSYVT